MKRGRPEIYTKELGDEICPRISKGESLRSIEKDSRMPSAVTVYSWLLDEEKYADFFKQYARARDTQAEVIFEELQELSDESVEDIAGDDKSDGARVQARKLQVDTRKWILARMKPRKYGDKMDVTSDGKALKGNTIVFKEFDGAESQ